MQYKLKEADPEWKPTSRFDNIQRKWVPAATKYWLLQSVSEEFLNSQPPVLTNMLDGKHWDRLKKGISVCARQQPRRWTDTHQSSWDSFFDDPICTGISLSPWVSALSSQLSNVEPVDQLPQRSSDGVDCPEPLVCMDEMTAVEWARSRKRRRQTSSNDGVPQKPFVELGDIVIVVPEEESRKRDEEAGYMLPISFGRVMSLHMDEDEPFVELAWYRSDTLSSKFSLWLQRNGEPTIDAVDVGALQVDPKSGELMKVEMTSRGTLKPSSRQMIKALIERITESHT